MRTRGSLFALAAFALLATAAPGSSTADPPPAAFGPAPSSGPLTGEEVAFGDAYRRFLDAVRTPRQLGGWLARELPAFRAVDPGDTLGRIEPGARLLFANRERAYLLVVVGRRPMTEGVRLVATHVDTPSFRVLGRALAEGSAGSVLRASAYGGVKPYQWEHLPLRLVGEVRARGGRHVDVDLGPAQGFAFVVSDLATEGGSAGEADGRRRPRAEAEVLVATVPAFGSGGPTAGARITFLRYLRRAYGLTEADLDAAELFLVPAEDSRDVGIDRSLVGAHGQDDRACSYPAIRAIAEIAGVPERTAIVFLSDREENGASGTVGAASGFLRRVLRSLARATSEDPSDLDLADLLARSRIVSSDVTAAVNPLFPEVHEGSNAARLGGGPALMKYTGHGGKFGAFDASPEFIASLRALWGGAGIPVQLAEIGRVDEGGGGTVSGVLAQLGAEVVDVGVGLVSMHSPLELSHKRDLHLLRRAHAVFLTSP